MVLLFSLLLFIYLFYLWKIGAVWKKIEDKPATAKGETTITVVIPVRNEAENIGSLLEDLIRQLYKNFEVLVVNDQSEDDTKAIVQGYIESSSLNLKLIDLEIEQGFVGSHKKKAITQAVENANGMLILCTDGDCQIPDTWIEEFAGFFEQNKDAAFISGPVKFQEVRNVLGQLQSLELQALIVTGAASMAMNKPNMCNGANMAFSKTAFEAVNGYEGIEHLASGDDEFLMQKIYSKYPEGVFFLKSKKAIVSTKPLDSVKELYYQRRRWAGKWRHHKNLFVQLLAGFIFFFYIAFIAAGIASIFGWYPWKIFCTQWLVKCIFELVFMSRIGRFFNKSLSLKDFALLEIFYSFYVVFFGVAANFGTYQWKGRSYKS